MIGEVLAAMLGVEWSLADSRAPADVLDIAELDDPLAQSRLWGAVYPEIPTGFLVETCLVESSCARAIGVHALDDHLGPSSWRGVWARQRVAHGCPYYPEPELASPEFLDGAGTRGNHGLNASYHAHLIGDCIPLDVFDLPFFSGWAAGEKASRICADLRAVGKRCTRERLRCGWARAKLGTAACGRVIRRWREALAARLAERPDLNPRERWTLARLRSARHARPEGH